MTIINALQKFFGAKQDQINHEEVNARLDAIEAKWSSRALVESAPACTASVSPRRQFPQSVGDAMDAMLRERGAYVTLKEPPAQKKEDSPVCIINPATGFMMADGLFDVMGHPLSYFRSDD